MGDAQSAQRGDRKDAAAAEESGKVEDTEDKPFKKNRQISEINGKADSAGAQVNAHCEDEMAAEAILSPDQDVSKTATSFKGEVALLENVEMNGKESPNEADANDDTALEMIEMDEKQNDINEGFKRFFRNIGLKLTVKKGTAENAEMAADEMNQKEFVEVTTEETESENTEEHTDLKTAQETYDNDSTTCPTLTDATSEDVLQNAEEKTTEVKEGVESDNVDAAATSPAHDDEKVQQDATLDEDQQPTSPSSPETEVVVSPIKRFFTTGIFSGLQKKKKPTEDEISEKELMEIERKDTVEEAEGRVNAQEDKEEISLGVEADPVEMGQKDNKLKEEILSAASAQATDDGKPPSTDAVSITVNEPEILSYQEKVQASPLKRLLSGSNLKKISKKQKGRRSSDSRLSDFGDQFSDQLLSFKESAEHQKEESPAAGEEEGAWASFRKLMTPKKHLKTSAETQIPGSVEETKPSDREQISNYSTEEGKKRKDSSVSWDAVLCGSGRRRSRSRKTSDSEDETPQAENDNMKHQSPPESSNEVNESSRKQAGSPSEADGGSTWKSFKKLVTPKRKAKDEEENKDIIQSDNEVTQDDSSFSIKKLLPGRKKSKSSEKQDQTSSDEADKDVASADEDSETPAVVPLSEFDAVETGVHIQTQAAVESHVPKEAEYELQQDLPDHTTEPLLPFDDLPTEIKKVQDKEDTSENEGSTTPTSNEEAEDLTEIISKHQQLSDIPEEGIITETMATLASAAEETARDDTIAEDLIEITSEAITAPEPVDVTLTDETEMISAVSQLSESSKTSGNTTPVPEEHDVKQTETLLHQVVETISMSPKEGLLCSDDINPERIVGSVSHQVLEMFLKKEPAILEIQRSSDATAINIGLNVEELDVVNKLAVKAQRESVSEVNQSVSKEIVSEVPSVRLDTAEIGVDEVHEVSVSHPEESIKELDSTDDSQKTEAVFLETLPEDEEIVADEGSVVQIPQEEKPLEMDSQEAESAATQEEESKDGGVEQEVQTLTQNKDQVLQNITDQVEVGDKDQLPVEELQEAAMLNSEEGRVQLLEKGMTSEDSPAAETHEFKEETGHPTEDNVEAEKEDEPQADDAEAEHVEEPEVLETVQAALLDSEEGSAYLIATETGTHKEESVQLPEEEVVSKDIPTQSGTDETKGETENVAEISVEPENKGLKTIALNTDNQQVAEVLQTMQEPTPASEEGGVQLLDKEVISETTAEVETVPDELKVETESLVDDDKPVDALETEHAPEIEAEAAQVTNLVSEEDGVQTPEKTDISEPIPEAETFEPTREPESNAESEKEQPEEDVPEVLLSHVNDVETEAEAEVKESIVAHVATESGEEGHAEEPEKQISPEDVPEPDSINAIASVTEEIQSQDVAELDQPLEDNEDQTREITPQDVQVEQEDNVAEAVGELQTLTAVYVSSVNGETAGVQVRENVFSEITPPTCVDNAEVTHEPDHEVHLSTVHVSVEGEKEGELPAAEVKNAVFEDALVSQVVTCYLKEASAAIPDASMAKTSEIHEALIDTVTSVQEFEETVMSTTPLVEDEVTDSAEEGTEVMMTKVLTAQIEDSHSIQVQVVDVDIKSDKTIVDQVLEVGVTETKEVTDVCQETFEEVDHLSATSQTEELINEEKVTVPEVIQHVKEKLPAAESLLLSLEQNVIKQLDAVTEGAGAAAQQVVEDLTQTFDIPGTSDVPVCNLKEDLEGTKPQVETSETDFKTEEVKLPSEELDRKKISEEAQISQMTQSQIVTPSNTGLVVPQNAGIISSVGSVDSPSSISLEFKINIQFGQAKAAVPPQPAGEKAEPVKTDGSQIGLRAVEPEKEIIPPQSVDSQRQTELTEAPVQATEIRETVHSATAERLVVMNQPILLDVGMQPIETVETVEEIKSTERVTLNVQATETIRPVRQTEKREVFLGQPVLSEAVQETKTKEPVKPTKEENEDVWLDAEEEIYTQKETESSVDGAEEPLKTESDQEEKTAAPRGETAPAAKTEDEESQEEILKTEATCEIESEGEDFAVALEQPETASVSVSKIEGD